jgi:hypothetical protein
MRTTTAALLSLAALLPLCASAADKVKPPRDAAEAEKDYKISFVLKAEGLERAGSFVTQGGSEGDYNFGGEDPVKIENKFGTGLEFKKHHTTVNCIPVANPNNGLIRAECQFEISGALKPAADMKDGSTISFQYKAAFEARPGKTIVLVDDPTRRVEVKIETIEP